MGSPALEVVCVALRRSQAREHYRAQDYKVCLLSRERGCGLVRRRVACDQEPGKAALQTLLEETGLRGSGAHALAVYGAPSAVAGDEEHTVALVFAVPVAATDSTASSHTTFCSLSSVLDDTGNTLSASDRHMLASVDQWLRDRHTIPFVDLDLLFPSTQEEGEGVGGVVHIVIENPLYSCHVRPPEDKLVISLNNPAFSSHSTLDLDATQA